MRISLLTQFFPPETFAGANRVGAMAAALTQIGKLTIAAPVPSYPDRAAYAGREPPPIAESARLRRTRAFTAQRSSWAMRAGAESLLAARLALIAGRGRADVVVVSSPSMFLGPAGLFLGRAKSARFVWDLRDLTWEYGKEGDVVAGAAARGALGAVARLMWRTAQAADLVVCATEGIADAVSARLPAQRVELIRNGVDEEFLGTFDPTPAPASSRTRLLYAGLIGHAQQLEVLLDVAALCPELDVVVAGDGPRRHALEADARARGLANLEFTGYQSPGALVELYHSSNVLFAQLRKSELHALTAAPSKLLEYMAAARPIIYAGEGAAAALVESVGCGVVTAPSDAAGIADAVDALTPALELLYGRRGRAYVERLPSRAQEMQRLASIVEALSLSRG
jgi:glycosyltransferase involved in cell wall biosynthesis